MPALHCPDLDQAAAAPLITGALRDWSSAAMIGVPAMPHLFATLEDQSCALLSPVLHSLFRFYQAALARPLVVGEADRLSEDEELLLAFVCQPELCDHALDCSCGIATGFDCALCSTRIMLARALAGPMETRMH